MILSALRPLKVLSLIWLVLISMTIIIPVIVLSYLPSWTANYVEVRIITYIVWVVIAVYSVAFAVREDRSKADQRVDRILECLSQDIQQTKDDYAQTAAHLSGLVDRLNDMDSNMREAFRGLGVPVPPRRILLQGEVTFGPAQFTASIAGHNRSKVVHFSRWVRGQARRFWKLSYG